MTFAQRSAADQAGDAELITAVRSGDRSAYASLYERHRSAAYHLARQLVTTPSEADDLVSDAFTKVFDTLLDGGGPDTAFRAYLLTAVRHNFYDSVRRGKKVRYTDDLESHDEGLPFIDTAIAGLDSAMAAKAFQRLPERWQTVLWHTEIEGESPAEIAPLLGMTANGVAALAYRAREGLRQAFLQEHIADIASNECKLTNERLGAWVRGGLSKRESTQVERHLEECDRCAAVAAEISDLNSGLRAVVAPLMIGGTALTAAYLAGGTSAKLATLTWAGATSAAAGFAKVSAAIAPAGSAGAATAAGTVAAGSAAGASSSAGAHGTLSLLAGKGGMIGVAATVVVAATATAVIVATSSGDPAPSANDANLLPPTTASAQAPATGSAPTANAPTATAPSPAPSVASEPPASAYAGPAAVPTYFPIPAEIPPSIPPEPAAIPPVEVTEVPVEPSIIAPPPPAPTAAPTTAAPTTAAPTTAAPTSSAPTSTAPSTSSAPTTSPASPSTTVAPPAEPGPVVADNPVTVSVLGPLLAQIDVSVTAPGPGPYKQLQLLIPAFGDWADSAQAPSCIIVADHPAVGTTTTWVQQCGPETLTIDLLDDAQLHKNDLLDITIQIILPLDAPQMVIPDSITLTGGYGDPTVVDLVLPASEDEQ